MKRVAVAMSGGVDSSATALFLKEQGYSPEGVTFLLFGEDKTAAIDAASVCAALGIPHHLLDLRKRFAELVVNPFVEGYLQGRTPNPCVFCNKNIKFGSFFCWATERGFDHIATGHYARVQRQEDGLYHLLRAKNEKKDQSYVLYQLNQEILSRLLLPLGEMTVEKAEIRARLRQEGIALADRPDSQDICFIPDGQYAAFVHAQSKADCPGSFVDGQGKVLGSHKGYYRYTVGQRKGLGVSLGQPAFVKSIDANSGNVLLTTAEQELYADTVVASGMTFCAKPFSETECAAKLRYAHRPAPATVTVAGDRLTVCFAEPQRAPTAGQAVVLYDGDEVLGGGCIL